MPVMSSSGLRLKTTQEMIYW